MRIVWDPRCIWGVTGSDFLSSVPNSRMGRVIGATTGDAIFFHKINILVSR
jgi:hypothetical protein